MRKMAIILCIIVIVVQLAGCRLGRGYGDYMILGKSEAQYLADIASDLELAYAPKYGMSADYVKSVLSKHMTEDVVNRLVRWSGKADDKDIECHVDYIGLAYGKHQRDGITRVLASISVKHGKIVWALDVEMKVGKDGKIYEISVY